VREDDIGPRDANDLVQVPELAGHTVPLARKPARHVALRQVALQLREIVVRRQQRGQRDLVILAPLMQREFGGKHLGAGQTRREYEMKNPHYLAFTVR
jgi:hypothetical protein